MTTTREMLFQRLKDLEINTVTIDHPHVYTVEQAAALDVPGTQCKNLFLKDKKGDLWLLVARAEAPVRLTSLLSVLGASKKLRFAPTEALKDALGVEPGSVTPFGLINDTEGKVRCAIDRALMSKETLSFHPLECNASTTISPSDLVRFVESTGHSFKEVDL